MEKRDVPGWERAAIARAIDARTMGDDFRTLHAMPLLDIGLWLERPINEDRDAVSVTSGSLIARGRTTEDEVGIVTRAGVAVPKGHGTPERQTAIRTLEPSAVRKRGDSRVREEPDQARVSSEGGGEQSRTSAAATQGRRWSVHSLGALRHVKGEDAGQ